MIAALLLAAGRSQRMGAFKPLLPFGDRTVVEACIDNLRIGGAEEIIVVAGHRADEMRESLSNVAVSIAINTDPDSEMAASIARGVEKISPGAKALFIALVDQPAIPPEVMRLLIAEKSRTGSVLVLPQYEGRGGHPVLIDLSLREELMNLSAERGLRGLFDEHRDDVLRVDVASPYVARDMDRWDDYQALYRDVFGSAPPENQGP